MKHPLFRSLALAACLWILGGPGNIAFSGASEREESGKAQRELSIMARYNVPIAELSGLAILHPSTKATGTAEAGGNISLFGIGDASYEIASFRITRSSENASSHVDNVAPILGKHSKDASQWEAIATDSLETLCMLSETRSEVSCVDLSLKEVKGTFKLDVSGIKNLEHAWQDHSNSRGEGMILMKNGHALVLKEKQPSMLVEFGPKGDSPMGYGPSTFLGIGEAFTISPSSHWVALKAWEFSDRLSELTRDASEITLGPDGRVYLLSQESATLIRLEKALKPDEDKVNVDRDAHWKLPAEIEKAEGLVIDAEMHPWIGIDIKQKDKPNLFRLSPLSVKPE
jgi:hypothetical protein